LPVTSLPAFAALAVVAISSGACFSSSNPVIPNDAGPIDAGAIDAAEASVPESINLGFYPSNIACALTASSLAAVASDAGIDLSTLSDVDIADASITNLYSSENTVGRLASGPVAYTTLRQPDGTQIGVYIARSWTIESTGTLTLNGTFPLALVALTTITVFANGTIDGTTNPPGGFAAPTPDYVQGAGPGGGAGASNNGTGAGAGGGSYCGTGGTGTSSTAVTPAYGTSALVPLVAGSSGGNSGYGGGTGGGALQLVAGTSITVGGTITVGGGAGFRSSGGGSGGALLLEAPAVTVTGTLAANGGGGANVFGGTPQGGQASATPAQGSTTDGSDAPGGNGSGGATINGGAAGALASASGFNGGGGGGAGYIRINTSGAAAGLTGTVSPSASTTCFSQGTLSSVAPTCN
jgi:hypothetical protein